MIEKYWLYLEPYTFIFRKESKALLYNSLSGNRKTFRYDGKLKDILDKLSTTEAMYCVELDNEDIANAGVIEFTEFLKFSYCGDTVSNSIFKYKPIVFPPILNLQYDVENLQKDNERSIGEGIKSYLTDLST